MRADKAAKAAAESAASVIAWRDRLTGVRPLQLPGLASKLSAAKTSKVKAHPSQDRQKAAKPSKSRSHRSGAKLAAKRQGGSKPGRAKRGRAGSSAPLSLAPVSAAGWLALAAVILAWPREKPLTQHISEGVDTLRRNAEISSGDPAEPHELERREPGRGRSATNPVEIPQRGWRDIFGRAWQDFNNDRIVAVAAGVTFFTLLAIFPAMAAFVSLYGLFADPSAVDGQLQAMSGVLPKDALGFLGDQMSRLSQAHKGTLGLSFAIGLLVSLWSANGAVKALFDGLNVAYQERERRSFVKLNLVSLAFTLGGMVFLALAGVAVVVVPVALKFLGLDQAGAGVLGPVIGLLRWPVLLFGAAGALAMIYRFGPSRAHARWRWINGGALAAALLWLAASMLFSWFVAHFGSYNKTYGSLGAVVGFMTWMWISAIVVLFGAEVNSEIEHQTGVDTTTGAPRPMGSRGAKVADNLGPSPPLKTA